MCMSLCVSVCKYVCVHVYMYVCVCIIYFGPYREGDVFA